MVSIIGAGMAGLLAGNLIRDRSVQIYEAAPSLPNNHSAVLRFRSSIVGDALDIPFRNVQVIKTVESFQNPVADSLAYSLKCTGRAEMRSILSADAKPVSRFIAPENLVSIMEERFKSRAFDCAINYDRTLNQTMIAELAERGPIISTIPMPALMNIMGYWDGRYDSRPENKRHPIWEGKRIHGFTINCHVARCDAFATVYFPDPSDPYSRISITGDLLTIEFPCPDMSDMEIKDRMGNYEKHKAQLCLDALNMMGLSATRILYEEGINIKFQPYAKILPIDDALRKEFIVWASANHRVFSLGRFATWRPGLLLDDLIQDVRIIRNLYSGGSSYDQLKK